MNKSVISACFGLAVLLGLTSKGSAENLVFYYQPDRSTYSTLLNITDDLNTITIRNIAEDFGFLTIGIHTFLENVTLSYMSYVTYQDHVEGTNIGLYWDKTLGEVNETKDNVTKIDKNVTVAMPNDPVFYLFRNSKTKFGDYIQVYLVISYYKKYDPVPGGCNLSFESMISPYQKVFYDEDMITVLSQPSSCPDDILCNKDLVDVTMYHTYFTLNYLDPFDYFVAISKMSSVKDVRKNGRRIPSTEYGKYKKRFSSYKGVGEVFAIVASYKGRSSAYIPTASFGCDVGRWYESCKSLTDIKWITVSAVSLILGSFFCIFGHRFFKTSTYLIGFASGILVVYSILLMGADGFHLNGPYTFDLITFGVSLFVGIFWLSVWLIFQSPLINSHLTFLLANVFIVFTVFYSGIADFSIIFTNDVVYWLSFSCMMLSFLILWTTFTLHISHMLTLSIVGSYLIILSTSYFLGGNLQYILINMRRRLTVKNFNWAVIAPPFNTLDLVQVIVGLTLIIVGILVQWRQQRGKPPFPLRSNNRAAENRPINESTPLLSDVTVSSGPAPPAYT